MKIQIKREPVFVPATIELTFETSEGLGLFSQLFNHANVCNICPEFKTLYRELEEIRCKEGRELFDKIKEALSK